MPTAGDFRSKCRPAGNGNGEIGIIAPVMRIILRALQSHPPARRQQNAHPPFSENEHNSRFRLRNGADDDLADWLRAAV